jgi:putative transposase
LGAEAVQEQYDRVADRLSGEYPQLTDMLDEAREEVLAYTHFPLSHWRKIRTNNPMENLNSQIKRRSKVVGIFPNRGSIMRLVGTILLEQNEDWMTGRRYMRLDSPGVVSSSPDEDLVSADQVPGCATLLTPH